MASLAAARAETQVYNILDFQFENGAVMSELRVAYETHGTLSPARDNAILLLHATSRDRHDFDAVIGPGKAFDTDRFFVITADAIGGGESASPADGMGQEFPRYTIGDMMAAQYALVTRGLEIPRLRAIYGHAMGAAIGLEWGIAHPESVGGLILLLPTPKAEPNYQLTIDLVASIVAMDPDWQGGHYTHNPVEGLRHAGMVYYPWRVSAAYLDRISPRRLARELEETARQYAEWDANSLIWRYAAMRSHDASQGFHGDLASALARVTAPTLLLPSASDRLFSLDGAQRMRRGIAGAAYAEILGDLGHDAGRPLPGRPEWEFIDRRVRDFLGSSRKE